MEKEEFFGNETGPNWQSSLNTDMQLGELNCSSEQLQVFYNPSWDNSMDQTTQFESALSSIVSSPAAPSAAGLADSVVIRELIGRLGSIYNSGEVSPPSYSYVGGTNNNSTNTSCYSTPLNSPPKLNLSMMDNQIRGNLSMAVNGHHSLAPFPSDPGFAERAARNACLGSPNFGGLDVAYRSVPKMESGKLSRVSSSQSLKAGVQMHPQDGIEVERKLKGALGSSGTDEAEVGDARAESSVSDQIPSANEMNARKRKAIPKSKPKEKDPKLSLDDDSDAKLSKTSETNGTEKDGPKPKVEQKQNKDNSKSSEPPKDYIHVRARRGQATDSHSLAERVRREKISERMKLLQDLVPGCNKVTGKAVMLDEIINYVQSLQRQVEFLSMKLATVNPRLDFNVESLLSKDVLQPHGSSSQIAYLFDSSAPAYPFGHQHQPGLQNVIANDIETGCSVSHLEASLHRSLSMQLPTTDRIEHAGSQFAGVWDNDLQNALQMGFEQNQVPGFEYQGFHGSLPPTHMKIER